MVWQVLRVPAGLLVALGLSLSGGAMEAQAQLRESVRPSKVDPSPSSLNPYRPFKDYVRRTDTLAVRPSLHPPLSPDSPRLSRGRKVLWGSVGLLVNFLCESRRDPYDTRCENCDRVGDRAMRALLEGMFSADP